MRILIITLCLFICSPVFAAKNFAKRFPTDTAIPIAPLSGDTTDGNCVEFDANGNIIDAGAPCGSGGGGSGNVGIGTVNLVPVYVGSSTLGPSSNVYVVGSNVGIGTTIPGGALAVMSGNVGIGTWIPAQTLDIKGTAATSGNVGIAGSLSSNNALNINGTARVTGATNSFGFFNWTTNTSLGGVQFTEGGDGTLDNGLIGNFLALGSNFATASRRKNVSFQGYNNLEFVTYQNTGVALEAMRLTSGGNLGIGTTNPQGALTVMNGNVGIGTWKPAYSLHVKGAAASNNIGVIEGFCSGCTTAFNILNNSANNFTSSTLNLQVAATGAGTVGTYGYVAGTRAGSSTTGVLSFGTNGQGGNVTEKMRIDENGNVGIGTTLSQGSLVIMPNLSTGNVGIGTWKPAQTLEISGSFKNNISSSGSHLFNVIGNQGDINVISRSSDTAAGLHWQSSNGRFGVGTNAQQSSMDVVGNVSLGAYGGKNAAPTNGLIVSGNVGIGTMTFDAALVVMGGNVGIGTWKPTATLEVNGTGNNSMTGNLGIGTTNPPNALYVVGTPMFTTGLNIGIGTASPTRLCIANNAITTCP